MRKLFFSAMITMMLYFFSPVVMYATDSKDPDKVEGVNKNKDKPMTEEVQAMIERIDEIKALDVSAMTAEQKKALRQELKAIKQELRATDGVFIPTGALIIIIILLILLI